MFEPITEKFNIREKKSFKEHTIFFIKLLNAHSQRNNLVKHFNNDQIDKKTIERLEELKIINTKSDLKLLQKTLGSSTFNSLIRATNYNLEHQKSIGGLLDKIDPSKRVIISQLDKTNNKPTLVDFFCGAGGLSLGFSSEGFKIELANDYEEVCIQTYKYNHPDIPNNKVILGDIKEILNELDSKIDGPIDVVVGGPPCQGYSTANQQRLIDDPRNELYKYFLSAISKIAPKFVLMENVKGMLPYANQVEEDYRQIRINTKGTTYFYTVSNRILISDDFGVAQKRQRLFFLAIRNDVMEAKQITPEMLFNEIENNNKDNKRHVLRDALEHIKPLKAPRVKNMTEVDDDLTGKKIEVNNYDHKGNSYLELINQGRTIEYCYNHKARYTNDINFEIYDTLKQGEDGTSPNIAHIMPYKHRNHIFKDKYFKLVSDKPSRTITAHLRMDCHSHIHPSQTRSITPREAARIQSFPDDYVFHGAYLKTYMQIGNAVPPIMAQGIARVIKKYI